MAGGLLGHWCMSSAGAQVKPRGAGIEACAVRKAAAEEGSDCRVGVGWQARRVELRALIVPQSNRDCVSCHRLHAVRHVALPAVRMARLLDLGTVGGARGESKREDFQRGRFLAKQCTYKLHTGSGTVESKRDIDPNYASRSR